MSNNFDLWDWFDQSVSSGEEGKRLNGEVIVYSSENNRRTENVKFALSGCMPTKIKAPALNAKDGQIAIEEMQVVYERLQISNPRSTT